MLRCPLGIGGLAAVVADSCRANEVGGEQQVRRSPGGQQSLAFLRHGGGLGGLGERGNRREQGEL